MRANIHSLARQGWPAALLGLAALCVSLRGDPPSGHPGALFSRVTIPVYGEDQARPMAIITAGPLRQDYERKGFFRIGLLPCLVVENLDIQLEEPEVMATALKRAAALLSSHGLAASRLEVRHLTVRANGEPAPRLTVGRLKRDRSGQWRADGLVARPREGAPVQMSEALLKPGSEGALLALPADPSLGSSINLKRLFAWEPDSTPSKENP